MAASAYDEPLKIHSFRAKRPNLVNRSVTPQHGHDRTIVATYRYCEGRTVVNLALRPLLLHER